MIHLRRFTSTINPCISAFHKLEDAVLFFQSERFNLLFAVKRSKAARSEIGRRSIYA